MSAVQFCDRPPFFWGFLRCNPSEHDFFSAGIRDVYMQVALLTVNRALVSSSSRRDGSMHSRRLSGLERNRVPSFSSGGGTYADAFSMAFEAAYSGQSHRLIQQTCIEANRIHHGANSVVYAIPHMPTFVLKVITKETAPLSATFIPDEPPFEGKNLGQVMGSFGKKYLVLVKQHGQPHAAPDWSDLVMERRPMTHADARAFKQQVKQLAQLPPASFNQLAGEIAFLEGKGYKVDSMNPNNVLVDGPNLHIIDYFKVPPGEDAVYRNSVYDMDYALLDMALFSRFHDTLPPLEQTELLEAARTVLDQNHQAAQTAGLSEDFTRFTTYLGPVDRWFGSHLPNKNYAQRYTDAMTLITPA